MSLSRVRRHPPHLRAWAAVLLLAVPGLFYVGIPVWWQVRHLSPLSGDEPHYVILADAILRDHSFEVGAAYDRDADTGAIYGPVDWQAHTRTGRRGTFSTHNVGLPVLIAPFFWLLGVIGPRMFLGAIAGLVPFLLFRVARTMGLTRPESAWLAVASSFGLPFLAASGQVFPDLTTGVFVLGLVHLACLSPTFAVSRPLLALGGLLLAWLPWLHLKNVFPTAVLACAMSVALLRSPPAGRAQRFVLLATPLCASIALLALYNWFAFGQLSGPYLAGSALGATLQQGIVILFGLHLDQAQGIFVQQPLFLLAVAGVPLLIRRHPFLAVTTLLVQLSVLVPNAFHPCWYGCASVSGRFMWAIAALWFLPLVTFHRELGGKGRATVAVLGGLAVAWQVRLMALWLSGPSSMYTSEVPASLFFRNSLFDGMWRRMLPSFYEFSAFSARASNVVGFALVVFMVLTGVLLLLLKSHAERQAGDGEHVGRPRVMAAVFTAWCVLVPAGFVGVTLVTAMRRQAVQPMHVDLLGRFDEALTRPVGAGSETFDLQEATIRGETRAALLARPPSRVTWQVAVPEDAILRVAIGVDEQAWDADGDGVLFRIGVSDGRRYQEITTRQVEPQTSVDDRRWIPITLDLGLFAGRQVELIFNTNSSPPGQPDDPRNDLAYWGSPNITSYWP